MPENPEKEVHLKNDVMVYVEIAWEWVLDVASKISILAAIRKYLIENRQWVVLK
jgi:hypothetical protein